MPKQCRNKGNDIEAGDDCGMIVIFDEGAESLAGVLVQCPALDTALEIEVRQCWTRSTDSSSLVIRHLECVAASWASSHSVSNSAILLPL